MARSGVGRPLGGAPSGRAIVEAVASQPDPLADVADLAGAPATALRPAPRPRILRRPTAAPAQLPGETLALHAVAVVRFLAGPRRPERWGLPGFAREVERVRRQLSPILSREMLAASYALESLHMTGVSRGSSGPLRTTLAGSALEVAYAVRWLELADGEERPGWQAWQRSVVDPPTD